MSPMKFLAVLAGGALFGFGLALSTMVRPEVVLSFLRFEDWGLMLVMGGAVGVTLLAYKVAPRVLGRPLLGGYFHQHVSHWNRDTLVGAVLNQRPELFGAAVPAVGVAASPSWLHTVRLNSRLLSGARIASRCSAMSAESRVLSTTR